MVVCHSPHLLEGVCHGATTHFKLSFNLDNEKTSTLVHWFVVCCSSVRTSAAPAAPDLIFLFWLNNWRRALVSQWDQPGQINKTMWTCDGLETFQWSDLLTTDDPDSDELWRWCSPAVLSSENRRRSVVLVTVVVWIYTVYFEGLTRLQLQLCSDWSFLSSLPPSAQAGVRIIRDYKPVCVAVVSSVDGEIAMRLSWPAVFYLMSPGINSLPLWPVMR